MFRALAIVALAYSYFQIKTGLPEVAAQPGNHNQRLGAVCG